MDDLSNMPPDLENFKSDQRRVDATIHREMGFASAKIRRHVVEGARRGQSQEPYMHEQLHGFTSAGIEEGIGHVGSRTGCGQPVRGQDRRNPMYSAVVGEVIR